MCGTCEMNSMLSRRRLMAGSLALAGMAAGIGMLPGCATATAPAPNAISPDAALERIMAGNTRYAGNTSVNRDFAVGRADRAAAQYPVAGLISCADARVTPELVFDQGPGELFVARVAGNFVNEDGLASLEYGVAVLNIPLLMVLGHSGCGAVDATIKVIQENAQLPGHLPQLANDMKPGVQVAIDKKPADLFDAAVRENVRYNVSVLQSAGPIISAAVTAGTVKVVGGVYDIATGKVTLV